MSNDTQKPTIEELLAILIHAYEWEGINDREYLADMNTRDKMHFADWATFIIQELHESNFEIKPKTPEPTEAQIESAAIAVHIVLERMMVERRMIEIKYRAWIKPIDEWADELYMNFTSFGIQPDIKAYMHDKHFVFNEEDLIIEQYTGLEDKNGHSIWEGDILLEVQDEEYPLPENDLEKMVVEFVFGGFVASNERAHIELSNYGITDTQSADFYKVIGNIHSNPELLESVE